MTVARQAAALSCDHAIPLRAGHAQWPAAQPERRPSRSEAAVRLVSELSAMLDGMCVLVGGLQTVLDKHELAALYLD